MKFFPSLSSRHEKTFPSLVRTMCGPTGHNAHFLVERTPHYLNLYVVLVGATSQGRKGTSRSTVDHIFGKVDKDWKNSQVVSGLSSGEGLIWHVRDKIVKEDKDGNEQVVDEGVEDKRLLVVEEEFSVALKSMSKEGNILSAILRQAWDSGNLRSLTTGRKYVPASATNAHISLVGHITKPELLRHLTSTEQCNGFGNRFLWFIVERSKSIPNPTGVPDEHLERLTSKFREAVTFGKRADLLRRDEESAAIWEAVYDRLTEDTDGMHGVITARGAPIVMRLASLYALLDCSPVIHADHLKAALAVWDYSFRSVREIFGDTSGDPIADKIMGALQKNENGLSRTDISQLFSNHNKHFEPTLERLLQMNLIQERNVPTGGRSSTIYVAKKQEGRAS